MVGIHSITRGSITTVGRCQSPIWSEQRREGQLEPEGKVGSEFDHMLDRHDLMLTTHGTMASTAMAGDGDGRDLCHCSFFY